MIMKAKITLFTIALVLISVKVIVANQNYFNLKQPNGVTFQAREAGYCCYIQWYETPDGYMVVRGPDRYYHYARPSEEKAFTASGMRVGIDAPNNVIKNLANYPDVTAKIKAEVERYNAAAEQNRQLFLKLQGKPDYLASSGTNSLDKTTTTTNLNIGVLLVEFNNLLHHSSPAYQKVDFENMLFSESSYYSSATPPAHTPDNENVFGSMRDYFQVQSSGAFAISGTIINPIVNDSLRWIKLGNTSNYPAAAGGVAAPTNLVVDAINAAVDSGWTVNYKVTLLIIAGSNQDLYETGIGYPKWYSGLEQYRFRPSFDWANWLGAPVFHERCAGWAGFYSGGVTFTHIGIWCHELGHVIGSGLLGGLYGHPVADASDWSAMRTGYRTGPLRKGDCPANFDPPAIISYGWAIPTIIAANMPGETISYINNKTQQKDFYRFNDPHPGIPGMFIIENRQYSDLNAYLPDWWQSSGLGGLVFWEWPSTTNDQRTIRPADNDLDDTGPPYWCDGDGGDPFPGLSGKYSISMGTTPNTNNTYGDPTGFAITSISSSAINMTANFYKSLLTSNSSEATSFNGSRKIIRDSGGSYHLVFASLGEIFYQKSSDGGVTWSDYKRLSSGNGNNKYPCIAERSGSLYVVWQRQNGSTYDIWYRSYAPNAWGAAITLATSVGNNDPLPVIMAGVPSHTLDLMVVYRGSDGLKYRRYSGGSWQAVAAVNGTSASSSNPSLIYKSDSYCYYNLTWDNGSDVYHQQFYGSSWGSATEVSATWTDYNQYSSYALTGNLDRHIVWQARDWIGGVARQVVMHNKNLNPTVFSEFMDYRDYLRPSSSGHSGGAFTVLWHDLWDARNIRKARYNGSTWEQGQYGAIIAANGMNASLSIANPPGATAKAVWSSAGSSPYTLTVGPSAGLSKEVGEEARYRRRVVFYQSDESILAWQMSEIEVATSSGIYHFAFPLVNDDERLSADQVRSSLTVGNIKVPADADSLVFYVDVYGKNISALQAEAAAPLQIAWSILDGKNDELRFVLATMTGDGEIRRELRASIPIQAFRGRTVTLRPEIGDIAIDKCQAALVHVYLNNAPALFRGATQQPQEAAEESVQQEARLRIHPNPFNPVTRIEYYVPYETQVQVAIYNVLGQELVTLQDGVKPGGEHSVFWDGCTAQGVKVGAGVYFCRMKMGGFVKTEKMTLQP